MGCKRSSNGKISWLKKLLLEANTINILNNAKQKKEQTIVDNINHCFWLQVQYKCSGPRSRLHHGSPAASVHHPNTIGMYINSDSPGPLLF